MLSTSKIVTCYIARIKWGNFVKRATVNKQQRFHELSTVIVDYHSDTLPSFVSTLIGRSDGLARQ